MHTLIRIKPRTVEKTRGGKIARSWAKKAYLNNDLQVVVSSSGSMRTRRMTRIRMMLKLVFRQKKVVEKAEK